MSAELKRSIVDRDTLVPISALSAVVALLVGGAVWATKISAQIDAVRVELVQIRGDINNRTNDRWRGSDMKTWVSSFDAEMALWSLKLKQVLGSDASMPEFHAPDPYLIRGMR